MKFYGIRNIRIASNIRNKGYKKWIYKSVLNALIKSKGFKRADYFGDFHDFQYLVGGDKMKGRIIELMVHPYINDKGNVIDVLDHKPLLDRLENLLRGQDLGTYPLN